MPRTVTDAPLSSVIWYSCSCSGSQGESGPCAQERQQQGRGVAASTYPIRDLPPGLLGKVVDLKLLCEGRLVNLVLPAILRIDLGDDALVLGFATFLDVQLGSGHLGGIQSCGQT